MKMRIVCLILGASVVNVSAEASWRSGSSFRTSYVSQAEVSRHGSLFDPMSAIKEQVDSMRGELCWLRGSVLEHEDCMEWLIPQCKSDADGTGEECLKLKNLARKQCLKGDTKACNYASRLGLDVHTLNREETHVPESDKALPPASIMDPASIMAPTPAQEQAKAAVAPPDVAPPDAIKPPDLSTGKPPAPAEQPAKSKWKNPLKQVKEWASAPSASPDWGKPFRDLKDYIAGGGDEKATTTLAPAAPSPALAQSPAKAPPQAPAQAPAQAPVQAAPTTETTTPQKTTPKTTEAAKVTKPATTAAPKSTPKSQEIADEDQPLIPSGDASPGGYFEAKPGDKLQSQGFTGKKVRHEDFQTYAADWQDEYGHPTEPPPKKSDAWKTGGLALPALLVYLAASAPRY